MANKISYVRDGLPYQIYNPVGDVVLQALESARYPKLMEIALLEDGYTIRLHDRKITRKELTGSAKGGT